MSRALRVLELLVSEPSGELGVTRVAQQLQIGKSTAHQILATLRDHDFIERDPSSARYRLGPRFLEAGALALSRAGLAASIRPILEQLARELDETVSLAVLAGKDVVYVQRVEATAALRVGISVGARVPVHSLPSGWVLLAGLPADRRRAVLDELSLSDQQLGELDQVVGSVETNGHSVVHETPFPGVNAIAVPVRDRAGTVVAALSVAGPSIRFRPEDHRAAVMETAARLSRWMGFPDATPLSAVEPALAPPHGASPAAQPPG